MAVLERLCRYITRPALSTKCLSMTRNGQALGKTVEASIQYRYRNLR